MDRDIPFVEMGFLRITWHDVFEIDPASDGVVIKENGMAFSYVNGRTGSNTGIYLGETGDHFSPGTELFYKRPIDYPLSCPFCGSADVGFTYSLSVDGSDVFTCACNNLDCKARGPWDHTKEGATDSWNRVAKRLIIIDNTDDMPF